MSEDYRSVQRFRHLRGAAYRPRGTASRPRPAAERARILSLIPGFSFEPLRALLRLTGDDPGPLLELDEPFGDGFDARDWAERLITRLEGAPEEEARAIFAALTRLHDGLVREVPLTEPADLISCPGSRTLSRIVETCRAWRAAGERARIVVSGGRPSYEREPAEVLEADAYAACLRLWGVPAAAILGEREASTTVENAAFLAEIFAAEARERGRPLRVLLVSSGFHTTRYALSMLRHHGDSEDIAALGVQPGPSFLGETLAIDEGGQRAVEKVAIVVNEYLKLLFDISREPGP